MGKKSGRNKGRKGNGELGYPNADQLVTASGDDIEKAWWMTCWLDPRLRLYRAPIASRLTAIAGSHESTSNLLILSSACDMPIRIGESLEYLAMKAFASASMMSPSGRNNILPRSTGNELVEIHTDSSAKTRILGISAVFSIRDCSYSYAGGMIVDNDLLIFHYGEFVAAASAMLIAVSHGYRDIVISTDSENLVRIWNDEEVGTLTENVDRQLLALKGILISQGHSVRIQHVKGHGVGFRNTMADGLAEMGYSRPMGADGRDGIDETIVAFDYAELRKAYEETLRLNDKLRSLLPPEPTSNEGTPLPTSSEGQTTGKGQQEEAETDASPCDAVPTDATSDHTQCATGNTPEANSGRSETSETPLPTIAESAGASSMTVGNLRPLQTTPTVTEERTDAHAATSDASQTDHQGQDVRIPQQDSSISQSPQPRPHSLSISAATVEVCRTLNETYPNVNVNRVDRLVASGAIEKWESLSKNQDNLMYARALLSSQSVQTDNRRIDAIWDALAKNVAKKIANKYSSQQKRSFVVVRTMLIARLCGVPIEPSIDYILSQRTQM